jgi:DNA polymerase
MRELYLEYLDIIRDFRKYLEKKMGDVSPSSPSSLTEFYQEIKNCQHCPLHQTRTNLVFGRGNPHALLMLVGEAPGREEDLQGKPFVGAAGKLLEESLREVGISRDKIYIANILKCRPPGNRDPKPEEIAACLPYLKKQIEIIQPRIICTLGKFSTQTLLNTTRGITHLRGKSFTIDERILIPVYHPAACIYKPFWKKEFLMDLRMVKERLIQVEQNRLAK